MAMTLAWRIDRISLTTAAPDALAAFYCGALGFTRAGRASLGGEDFARAMGLSAARAEAVTLRLGAQSIELLAFAQPGRPYPAERRSDDPIFQHMAIVVTDMRAAHARLSRHPGWAPVSTEGPQRLPATSGGVTAFKFRDPEGHPLELLEFPPGAAPPAWAAARGPEPCLGIDHSAIVVSDTMASAGFYAGLGFGALGGSLNHGPEQQRLDGLAGAEVRVTALGHGTALPHLELLDYRHPRPGRPGPSRHASNDVATARLVLRPPGQPRQPAEWSRARLLEDPDGHHLLVSP
jgi:catechol 2,3-dioxygenase-like lactoylglutathione lyase family enzyme